jgi:hypothetical protein
LLYLPGGRFSRSGVFELGTLQSRWSMHQLGLLAQSGAFDASSPFHAVHEFCEPVLFLLRLDGVLADAQVSTSCGAPITG